MNIGIPQTKVKNLLNRASFGLRSEGVPPDQESLFQDAVAIQPLQLVAPPSPERAAQAEGSDASTRKKMIQDFLGKSRQELMKLNIAWLDQIVLHPTLRERMTFFWHGHFACRTLVPFFAQQQNNTLRTYALGTLPTLLMAVSKDAAMLQFLNNQQNKKDHPNENFAREVMELFTLGRGNYSELDVKEAARAFTGWGFNLSGEYQFRPRQHDNGLKTFRGKSGNFAGEQIIESILEDPTTARFITRKLYRQFISDSTPPEPVVQDWADTFFRSGYNIDQLIRTILSSNEFNKPSTLGARIKSPVELLVSMLLHTGGKFENPQSAVFLQRALGQVLFYPPNVSGWPVGKGWIDSTSLTFRVSLPSLLFGEAETDFEARDDGDANGLGTAGNGKRRLHCAVDWNHLATRFSQSTGAATLAMIEDFLLARPTSIVNRKYITAMATAAPTEPEFIRRAFIGYMSLPDYQLC